MKKLLVMSSFILLFVTAVRADKLRSPWDEEKVAVTDVPYKCPGPPEFAKTLNVEGYYTDSHYSVIDPAKKAAYEKADEGLVHLGQYAGLAADAYLEKGSKAAAACVYSLLESAAKADAWAGDMPHGQGVYDQNWMLSGTAIPYLKVRDSGAGTPAQDAEIQKWLKHVATQVRDYFDEKRQRPGSDAWNNHMYWAGLAIAAQGIAGNDKGAFEWGMDAYHQGVEAIEPDGSLTAEMNRKAMALHYQLYALGPLIMLAELGEVNGLTMYEQNHGAIHSLVKFDTAALEDPSVIAKAVGVEQNVKFPLSGQEIGWAVPYVKRFPDAQLSAMIAKAPWVSFWQWGGEPPDLQAPAPPRTPGRAAFEAGLRNRMQADVAAKSSSDNAQAAAFLGAWCGQGIPSVRASITNSGSYLTLTNENGAASTGRTVGKDGIVAPGWDSVTGRLSPNHSQIDWSNGSFWERCELTQGGKDSRPLNLTGTWYGDADLTQPCIIRQHGNAVHIACGKYGNASGQLDKQGHLSTDWSGRPIAGLVTPDHNHIDWDNQTYWTRSTVYAAAKN
jgi:poly(beta-D-mannuronate) lyase